MLSASYKHREKDIIFKQHKMNNLNVVLIYINSALTNYKQAANIEKLNIQYNLRWNFVCLQFVRRCH